MTDLIKPDAVNGIEAIHNDLLPWYHHVYTLKYLDYHSIPPVGERVGLSNWWWGRISWVAGLNEELGWDVITAAGTWDVTFYVMKRNDYPIVQAKVDGANVGGTIDLYNATHTNAIHILTGVVLTRGVHRFTLRAVSKNASSSGYVLVLCGLTLARTA